jgi:hypothetical protein
MIVVGVRRFADWVVRSEDVDLDAGKAAAADFAHLKACIDIERSCCLLKTVEGNARTNESAEQHVAADTGKTL